MIKVYFGEDRVQISNKVKQELEEDYEVFEGVNLTVSDLPSLFRGVSLLGGSQRSILIKDVSENGVVWECLSEYIDTEYKVVIWETKLDKRTAGYKKLKDVAEFKEFPLKQAPEAKLVFGVLEMALRDGKKAVETVEKIENNQDPYMFFGLLVTQALKRFEMVEKRGNAAREKRILRELGELDMQMKSAAIEPWMLVKMFLLRVGNL